MTKRTKQKRNTTTGAKRSVDTLPLLIDSNEVCRLFGLKRHYLRDLRHQQRIPFVKIGRLVRYDPLELTDWIKSGQCALFEKNNGKDDK